MSLTVGSLFSGIGGIDLGLERAGMRVVWQVEKDEYARKVLRKHWPKVHCFEDIRNINGVAPFTGVHAVGHVDVLAGGFPCQDISVAGKGAGIKEGTRSGLWSEFARLIRELRPRYVLVENVPALRSRGLGQVLGDLAACGYDAEWDCFPASAFGAPHRRDRLFIVAYPKREFVRVESGRGSGEDRADTVFPSGDGFAGDVADAEREPGNPRGLSDASAGARGRDTDRSGECPDVPNADSIEEGRPSEPRGEHHFWTVEPDVGRVAHGISKRVDRLRCLGNAVVPQVAEYVGRLIVAHAARQEQKQEQRSENA